MKRILIGTLLFALATSVFCGLNSSTAKLRAQRDRQHQAWQAQTQGIAAAQTERLKLAERVRASRAEAHVRQTDLKASQRAAAFKSYYESSDRHWFLSPETCEDLRAELGFNWHTTGDFVVVSKVTLFGISLDGGGITRGKVSDVSATVLALTPAERNVVDDLGQQTENGIRQWVTANVQRDEPTTEYPLKLKIPGNATLAQDLSGRFTNGIATTLGMRRGEALLHYAADWMYWLNLKHTAGGPTSASDPTSVAVHHYGRTGNGPELEVVIRRGSIVNSTPIRQNQTVPPIVNLLYPGGWEELAQREGLELPKEFQPQKAP